MIWQVKKYWLYIVLLLGIFGLALFIRINNLINFDTSWADDGGAHITYVEILQQQNRLPNLDETYVAWHEPLYYFLLDGWIEIGKIFSQGEFSKTNLNWSESLNILIYFVFLVLVWIFTYQYSNKNKWLALLNTFVFSILFVGVKISSYINNELLFHTAVLLLLILFYRWKLASRGNIRQVIIWSVLLALACFTKVTGWIIFIAILLLWAIQFLYTRKKYLLKYIILLLLLVPLLNLPWIIYKQHHYQGYFSINIYDDKPRQNIVVSDGWDYIFKFNTHIFTDYPYWHSQPDSYVSILLSDSFGNYYNLFHNSSNMEALPQDEGVLVGNGQKTTDKLWNSLLNTNRVALLIVIIWWLGFLSWCYSCIKKKKIEDYDLFLLIVMLGGWTASIFHNLRLPYLEAGVLKAHFIYFTYPIMTFFAYRQWWNLLNNKIWWVVVAVLPWLVYLYVSWDILLVDKFV